ncbi:hypothetical protein [Leeuwenhoekiella nanhaiensis]|uniref:STAS/SEC14 domain-containing protein n=1 Tax=Leeuwenhoekiella nanhaiensis TaxID=1655491 RepID=A0A2G1VUM7_9FLAO|nr:hypothetical protein [Leeuwenhoekiella nanhaiensis]PHQ30483.1 hypothetical protein CJ305_05875 [Leeuwenhoekiella nanhaiensis]
MTTRLDLEIGILEFYDHFVIGLVNPDVNFGQKERLLFLKACLEHFKEKPFGYISVRTFSYSIDPLIYLELNKVESLKAFAVVYYSKVGKGNAELEGQFYKKLFGIFETQSEAMKWMTQQIKPD